MSSTKQCVFCKEDQGDVGNHNGCENSCDACRKFFESEDKEMTPSSHKSSSKRRSSKSETAQDSTIKCVICGEQGKIGNHFGGEKIHDACRKFFESNVKEMTKSSHKFLGGKNADRHCYNNFGCQVKGKRACTSCRFLKCIDNQMNPELPLRNAAREVQENDPEGKTKALDDYTKELRPIFESNLDILLSAAHEARANSNIQPTMISGPANNYEESSETVYSDATCTSQFSHLTVSQVPPQAYNNIPMDPGNNTLNIPYTQPLNYSHDGYMPPHGTYDNIPGNHTSNDSYPQQSNYYHDGYMPNVQGTHNWNNQNNGNEYTDLAVPYDSSQVSVANNPQQSAYSHYGYVPNVISNNTLHNTVGNSSCNMHTHLISNVPVHYDGNTISHAGSYGKTRLNSHTHGTMGQVDQFYPPSGNQSTGTWNHEVIITPSQMREKRFQNIQLDPAVQKDIEIKDTTREGSNKRKNPPKDVNKTGKRSISADPFKRLAIKLHTEELCKILNTFGMKMDTGYECDYGNNPQDKRCECSRSLGPVTQKKTLQNTMLDGPHHFANWMCISGLHPDIFALENPTKVLSRKSICAAGRFYQSRDLKEYFETESGKEGGKYVELEKSELRSGVNYFICCKRKEQQYWQIYYGTDERCVAGYGHYPDYDERKYFFNKEFDQQRKDQTSSGK